MELTGFEDIEGFEGLYKIDKSGNIYSCRYKKIMTHMKSKDDYMYVHLSNNGKRFKCFIHRRIALQWIPNPNNLAEVDHIDRNKSNNALENLRWVDKQTNRRNQNRYDEGNTPEALEKRKERTRERARLWARKDRERKRLGETQ